MTSCSLLAVAMAILSAPPNPAHDDVGLVGSEPFSVDPARLASRISGLAPFEEDTSTETLLLEDRFVFHDHGGYTRRTREVFRVLTDAGVRERSAIYAVFAPWTQDRPQISARVVDVDGVAHLLDPANLAEAEEGEEDNEVFSDRRVIEGPLPAIRKGVVVETVVVQEHRRAPFVAGTALRLFLAQGDPIRTRRVIIDVPTAMPLRAAVSGAALPSTTTTNPGRKITTWLARDLARPPWWALLPDDQQPLPLLSFATGKSWSEVAAAYAVEAERHIGGAALKPVVVEAVGATAGREAQLQSLVAFVQERVRYTGVEFGAAAIVPHTPQETLQNRFGDCKDMAAVFVALARGAGFDAHVALLRTAGDLDVSADMPGLGLFDHAIAVVAGTPPTFIDLTATHIRVGEVPLHDQGRRALIVDPRTTALVTLPVDPKGSSRVSETRDVTLAAEGKADVRVTVEASGLLAFDLRTHYDRVTDPLKRKEAIGDFRKRQLEATTVTSVDVDDAGRGFRSVVVLAGSQHGGTDEHSAVMALNPHLVLQHFPYELQPLDEDDDPKRPEPTTTKPTKPRPVRSQDYFVRFPVVADLHYRVRPPPGYVLDTVPKDVRAGALGYQFSSTSKRAADGAVEVDFHYEAGKTRLTIKEAEQLRAEVAAYLKDAPQSVAFAHGGAVLMGAGKPKEGFAVYRQMVEAEPSSPLRHEQLSVAFLKQGLGDLARAEARRAVELAPDRAAAWWCLGWALLHDSFGRERGRDFDRDGAIAAFEKTARLDPERREAIINVGFLHEHSVDGVRYGPGAQYELAIKAYERLFAEKREELEGVTDERLANVLFRAGRHAEARARLEKAPPTAFRSALRVASTSLLEGAPAALKLAARLTPDPREARAIIMTAGDLTIATRRYEVGVPLFRAAREMGAELPANGAVAVNVVALERHETFALPAGPEGLSLRVLIATLAPDRDKQLKPLVAPWLVDRLVDVGVGVNTDKELDGLKKMGLDPAVALDAAVSNTTVTKEGSDVDGWRVTLQSRLARVPPELHFVVKDKGAYKLVAVGAPGVPAMGVQVDRYLKAGNLRAARLWLGWAAELFPTPKKDEELLAGSAFLVVWATGKDTPAELALAASMLQSSDATHVAALTKVSKERGAAVDRATLLVRRTLFWDLMSAKRFAEARDLATRLQTDVPTSKVPATLLWFALKGLEDHEALAEIAQARVTKDAADAVAVDYLAGRALLKGDLPGARVLWRAALDTGRGRHGLRNQIAWSALFTSSDLAMAVQDAELVNRNVAEDPAFLHTLAALYAETARPAEALTILARSIAARKSNGPQDFDWYVIGRIEESYGLLDAARAAYARCKSKETGAMLTSELAERRLAALSGKKEP
ncbi:MAG: DUF3857 domain-containing protein [Deltaproteobacteria bacterium]|nr:DUF3857 domain-containing protein [Deltaproteobacteria bacterium]